MAKEIIREDIPVVKELMLKVLGTDNYADLSRMGGLTNHTYKVTLENGEEYVVRLPGEGTEEVIVRSDEKISTKLACDLGVDAQMLYFGEDGSKVTEYIKNAVTMSAEALKNRERIEQVAEIFRKMHTCGVDTKVPFEVFEMAASYEKVIKDNNVSMFDDYNEIKAIVMEIKAEIDNAINKVENIESKQTPQIIKDCLKLLRK